MAEGGQPKRQGKQGKRVFKRHPKKSEQEDAEVKRLENAIAEGKPAPGTTALATADPSTGGYAAARTFEELPLSRYTLEALSANKFINLTAIQRAALPHALAGRDILGAAKTGSGKTLAFLIPLVERLFRSRWTRFDGLGGLVLTPTRELALQIFQELRKIGTGQDLSAGLLIGGKNVKEEQASINRMNVLVATPGRLLQHMDETPGFDTTNLQVLVLDEADRLLDMGFAATLDAILDALPNARQTMLFSATQTKSVKDLARLSLRDPEYLSVHEASDSATPLKLQQAVAVVGADQKMDTLWSFIKSHLAAKTIVFLSTCKQVRFFHEVFRKLRPGVPLRALHGGMKQMKRMGVFQEFCAAEHMVLFATDVAGRGLDFPSVDWVVQVDCPEDAAAYIHRVGRTARYLSAGRALLLLTPQEAEGMKAALTAAKIPVKPIKVNPAKQQSIGPALQALLSKTTQLKEWGQRALVSYVRSIFLAPSKEVFDVASLPLDALAASWGMAAAPRMRFLKRVNGKREVVADLGADQQQDSGQEEEDDDQGGDDSGDEQEPHARPQTTKQQQAAAKTKQPKQAGGIHDLLGGGANGQAGGGGGDGGDDDEFLVIKQRNVFGDEEEPAQGPDAAAGGGGAGGKKKRLKIKVNRASGQRVVFDADGQALDPLEALAADPDLVMMGPSSGSGQQQEGGQGHEGQVQGEGMHVVAERPEARFTMAAQLMKQRDQQDKARQREQKAALKAEAKAKRRAADGHAGGGAPTLSYHDDDDDGGSQGGSGSGSDGGDDDDDVHMSGSGSGDDDDGSGGSSDDDEEEEHLAQRDKGRPHKGHGSGARNGTDHVNSAAAKAGGSNKRPGVHDSKAAAPAAKRSRPASAAGLSLAEQEAAVLARIAAKR